MSYKDRKGLDQPAQPRRAGYQPCPHNSAL